MTLCELFTPLISYMVSCRSEAARGKAPEQELLMSHLMREMARIRKTGAASRELNQEALEDACRYTAFYIDYMVHEGAFPYARQWQDVGRSRYNELAGDEKFFDYMRRWLEEDTPQAREHLRLMYDMVASGFSGSLGRRSVRLEELMRRTAEVLAIMPEEEATRTLFGQQAESPARLASPRNPVLRGLCICGIGAAALVLACIYYLHSYRSATDSLRHELSETQKLIEAKAMRHALNADTLVAVRERKQPRDANAENKADLAPAPRALPSPQPSAAPPQPSAAPPQQTPQTTSTAPSDGSTQAAPAAPPAEESGTEPAPDNKEQTSSSAETK